MNKCCQGSSALTQDESSIPLITGSGMVLGSQRRKVDMNKLNKALVGTAAAAAMAVSATPAMANGHKDKGVSAGEVLAGVAVIGAIAAIATSGKKDRGYQDVRYRDGDYRHGDYRNGRYDRRHQYRRIGKRKAVKRCVRAAENRATRRGQATVTRVKKVERTRYGYKVKGRILVERGRYGRIADKGKFTCHIDGNRVSNVRFKGLEYARRY
jgi:hypothetical protein